MDQKNIFILIIIFLGVNIIHSTEWQVSYRIFWMDNYQDVTSGETKVFDSNQYLSDEHIKSRVYSEFGFDTYYGQKLVKDQNSLYIGTQRLEIISIKKLDQENVITKPRPLPQPLYRDRPEHQQNYR